MNQGRLKKNSTSYLFVLMFGVLIVFLTFLISEGVKEVLGIKARGDEYHNIQRIILLTATTFIPLSLIFYHVKQSIKRTFLLMICAPLLGLLGYLVVNMLVYLISAFMFGMKSLT